MTRAVLFDVDGTLVDTNALHAAAWQQAFAKFGVDLPIDAVRDQIGKGGDNLIPALLPEDLVARCQSEIEEYRSRLFQRDYLPRAVPFEGVRPLFEALYGEGVRIVLASSAKRSELDFHLALIGCADLIHGTTSKDDVENSKPCPDIFEAALSKSGVAAEAAVVVGDSPWDVKAAGKAGLRAIAVRSGGFDEAWLREAGADGVYDGPAELLARRAEWLAAA